MASRTNLLVVMLETLSVAAISLRDSWLIVQRGWRPHGEPVNKEWNAR